MEQDGEESYFEATSVPKDTYDYYERGVKGLPPPLRAWEPIGDFGTWYEPLIDTPHLFLEFARLYEHKDPEEAVLDWISRYGLLGLHESEPHRFDVNADTELFSPWKKYSQRGGSQETLARVLMEAHEANLVLASYEAALSKDVEKLEQIALKSELPNIYGESWQDFQQHLELTAAVSSATYEDALIDSVVISVLQKVGDILEAFTFPAISHRSVVSYSEWQPINDLWTPDLMVRSLFPRNLLGALYLQFYWLITSAAELSRCKYCGRIIPHAPMISADNGKKTRKTRKDKEYCDSRCRQNYHYHNSRKHRRRTPDLHL